MPETKSDYQPVPLVPIPRARLPEMIGRPVHLRGCRPGCVWILRGIQGEMMRLQTPSSGRWQYSHVNNAQYTRYWASQLTPDS